MSLFTEDHTKSFFLYDPECFVDNTHLLRADLAISLDVVFHLIEDRVFETYMTHLFSSARRFVIVYSSDFTTAEPTAPHVRHRKFTSYVAASFPQWTLLETIVNQYPIEHYPEPEGSFCDFHIFGRSDSCQ